jgi:peptidoglycan-binding protein ArfA
MTGSGDARVTATATQWRTESRFYRRSPGWGWLAGLLLVPLLFGWIGASVVKPTVDVNAPSVSMPDVSMPSLNFSPLSILRNGNDFTLSGFLPDLGVKEKLLSVLTAALGPAANLIDKIDITPGATAPDFGGFEALFKAAVDVPDFQFTVEGDTMTLSGIAPSEEVRAAVEAAAKAGWPDVTIINNISIEGAPVSCDNLQTTIDADLAVPVKFQTGSDVLTADGQQQLMAVVPAVKACPDARLTVIGHTDNTGTDAINGPLSENRARAVVAYLESQGIPADSLTSEGAGATQPVADNDTEAGRAQNRRTEIKVN